MSKMIEVDYETLRNLLEASSEALELLDAVHCYDTEVYENLKSAIDNLKSESLSDEEV